MNVPPYNSREIEAVGKLDENIKNFAQVHFIGISIY